MSLSDELGLLKLYLCAPSSSNCITEFSLFSTSRLVAELLRLNVYDCTPIAFLAPLGRAFVCMEMNRFAFDLFAMLALSPSGMKTSLSLVKMTFTSGLFDLRSRPTSRAILRLIFFSILLLDEPIAPGSLPPCPGSRTTINGLLSFSAAFNPEWNSISNAVVMSMIMRIFSERLCANIRTLGEFVLYECKFWTKGTKKST